MEKLQELASALNDLDDALSVCYHIAPIATPEEYVECLRCTHTDFWKLTECGALVCHACGMPFPPRGVNFEQGIAAELQAEAMIDASEEAFYKLTGRYPFEPKGAAV